MAANNFGLALPLPTGRHLSSSPKGEEAISKTVAVLLRQSPLISTSSFSIGRGVGVELMLDARQ